MSPVECQIDGMQSYGLFCILSLRLWLDETYGREGGAKLATLHLVLLLGFLWANFAPLYYILAVK
jgi:hypothetical protein